MDALGPTPSKIEKEINSFLRDLRKTSPDLSKEEILAKIKIWINSHSDKNPEQEAKIVNRFYLKLHPDKLLEEVNDKNILYLKKAAKEELDFYFKGFNSAFTSKKVKKKEKLPNRMEYTSPDRLIQLYTYLYVLHRNEKEGGAKYSPAQIFKEIESFIINVSFVDQDKKLFAKYIADHLALIHESIDIQEDFNIVNFDILPLSLIGLESEEGFSDLDNRSRGFFFFKEKISEKNYKIYFKNLEKEVIPPQGFFAKLRFNYRNSIAFALRIFKNDIWNILKGAIIVALAVPIVLSALVFIVGASEVGLVAAVAALVAETASIAASLAVVAASAFVLSIPLIAGGLHSNNPLNGYLFPIKMLLLTPVVAISSLFSLLFSKSDPVVKAPEPQADPELASSKKPPKQVVKPKQRKKKDLSAILESSEPEFEAAPASKAKRKSKPGKKSRPADDLD